MAHQEEYGMRRRGNDAAVGERFLSVRVGGVRCPYGVGLLRAYSSAKPIYRRSAEHGSSG